ncbi:MAG: GNAT family N-acetyltransferase [Solidesulfovibrio sp.]|uniref:GNAT family N-acetyltransferase n=1 Tax=Solidesulfovibrio sp. TaxID=2910990 RepID=UPI002B1FE445|nr:GNAT family N-acetyltransferase [Solidesulfovibrio sp.]MEA4856365.1 GNAT family N-acetyltransferase [Solidesulfovibrio sp.]
MDVADLTEAQLPALAGLMESLSGLASDRDRLAVAHGRMAASPDYHLLGATVGGVLAGAALGIVCLDVVGPCRPFLVVENVFVAGRYRRRGVGRGLLTELERRARQRDCLYLMLVSGPGREEARAFYAALGYGESRGFKKRL